MTLIGRIKKDTDRLKFDSMTHEGDGNPIPVDEDFFIVGEDDFVSE